MSPHAIDGIQVRALFNLSERVNENNSFPPVEIEPTTVTFIVRRNTGDLKVLIYYKR